ncbi:MAG: hypothetical protein JWM78_2787 [Verrucomicrobiaceae bacterium]|nr:hypothetical protein [Verrucomicrobiaceae bacterium]
MTVAMINKALRKYWIVLFFVLIPLLYALNKNVVIAKALTESLSAHGLDFSWRIVNLWLLGANIIFMLAAIFAIQRKIMPSCQSCKKGFTPNNCGVVIATKNCPYCGEKVIADNP